MEEWRKIENYNYSISTLGRVRNDDTNKYLSIQTDYNGYKYVQLNKNKKKKNIRIHRLIACAFLDNPENNPVVDHINRIKDDNRLENLRWCTRSGNSQNTGVYTNNKLQEKNICKYSDREYYYCEIMKDGKRFRKRFKTLNEAIEFRDEMLNV